MKNYNNLVNGISNKFYLAKLFWCELERLTAQAYEFKQDNDLTRATFIHDAIIDSVADLIDRTPLVSLCREVIKMENGRNLSPEEYSELEISVLQAVGESLGPEAQQIVLGWLFKL